MRRHGRRDAGGAARATGLVLRISARHATVLAGERTLRCGYAPDLFDPDSGFTRPVAAGDTVDVELPARADPRVVLVHPRRNYLSRMHGPRQKEQVIVANPDRVLVISSAAEPSFRPRLIDRILVAVERAGAVGVIVINKIDLVTDRTALLDWQQLYARLGYAVVLASVASGEGVEAIRALVGTGITVACGQSGVGKSSLLTALDPSLRIETQTISDRWGKGRHTTTSVTLHPLPNGGFIADTPGVRSFGIAGLEAADIAVFFREFQPYIDQCRFNSCTHVHEPDCAVMAAVADGRLDIRRYDSYRRIVTGEALEEETADDELPDGDDEAGDPAGDGD